jgi:hypothetical protein
VRRSTFLILSVSAALGGCAQLSEGLNLATTAALGIEVTVGSIKVFVDDYFVAHPNPSQQATVDAALLRTEQALALVVDALKTASDIVALNASAVMTDLQNDYTALIALTKPLGVTASPKQRTGAMRVDVPDGPRLVVPQTLSLV